jgi:hypothetical protein
VVRIPLVSLTVLAHEPPERLRVTIPHPRYERRIVVRRFRGDRLRRGRRFSRHHAVRSIAPPASARSPLATLPALLAPTSGHPRAARRTGAEPCAATRPAAGTCHRSRAPRGAAAEGLPRTTRCSDVLVELAALSRLERVTHTREVSRAQFVPPADSRRVALAQVVPQLGHLALLLHSKRLDLRALLLVKRDAAQQAARSSWDRALCEDGHAENHGAADKQEASRDRVHGMSSKR